MVSLPQDYKDYVSLLNTLLIGIVGVLIGWFSQDMRRRMVNVERRLSATVRGLFYLTTHDKKAPLEVRTALEDAMKEK